MTGVYALAELLMEYYMPLQALVGTLLFSLTTFYSYQIVQHFEDHREYSLTMFSLNEKATYSFWIMSFSAIIFALGMAIGNLGMGINNPLLGVLALFSSFVLFLGLAFFTVNVSDVTAKSSEP
ncbi:MAG: hypothetical protein ABEK01_05250 [Candidatus Nanohaloarchaea archaeon]